MFSLLTRFQNFLQVVIACLTITPTLNLSSLFSCSSFSLVCSLSHMVANNLKDEKHWALLTSWGHILNSFAFFLSCNIKDFGNIGIAVRRYGDCYSLQKHFTLWNYGVTRKHFASVKLSDNLRNMENKISCLKRKKFSSSVLGRY